MSKIDMNKSHVDVFLKTHIGCFCTKCGTSDKESSQNGWCDTCGEEREYVEGKDIAISVDENKNRQVNMATAFMSRIPSYYRCYAPFLTDATVRKIVDDKTGKLSEIDIVLYNKSIMLYEDNLDKGFVSHDSVVVRYDFSNKTVTVNRHINNDSHANNERASRDQVISDFFIDDGHLSHYANPLLLNPTLDDKNKQGKFIKNKTIKNFYASLSPYYDNRMYELNFLQMPFQSSSILSAYSKYITSHDISDALNMGRQELIMSVMNDMSIDPLYIEAAFDYLNNSEFTALEKRWVGNLGISEDGYQTAKRTHRIEAFALMAFKYPVLIEYAAMMADRDLFDYKSNDSRKMSGILAERERIQAEIESLKNGDASSQRKARVLTMRLADMPDADSSVNDIDENVLRSKKSYFFKNELHKVLHQAYAMDNNILQIAKDSDSLDHFLGQLAFCVQAGNDKLDPALCISSEHSVESTIPPHYISRRLRDQNGNFMVKPLDAVDDDIRSRFEQDPLSVVNSFSVYLKMGFKLDDKESLIRFLDYVDENSVGVFDRDTKTHSLKIGLPNSMAGILGGIIQPPESKGEMSFVRSMSKSFTLDDIMLIYSDHDLYDSYTRVLSKYCNLIENSGFSSVVVAKTAEDVDDYRRRHDAIDDALKVRGLNSESSKRDFLSRILRVSDIARYTELKNDPSKSRELSEFIDDVNDRVSLLVDNIDRINSSDIWSYVTHKVRLLNCDLTPMFDDKLDVKTSFKDESGTPCFKWIKGDASSVDRKSYIKSKFDKIEWHLDTYWPNQVLKYEPIRYDEKERVVEDSIYFGLLMGFCDVHLPESTYDFGNAVAGLTPFISEPYSEVFKGPHFAASNLFSRTMANGVHSAVFPYVTDQLGNKIAMMKIQYRASGRYVAGELRRRVEFLFGPGGRKFPRSMKHYFDDWGKEHNLSFNDNLFSDESDASFSEQKFFSPEYFDEDTFKQYSDFMVDISSAFYHRDYEKTIDDRSKMIDDIISRDQESLVMDQERS